MTSIRQPLFIKYLLLHTLVTGTLAAQWTRTNGPEGGVVTALTTTDGSLFTGIMGGGVFRSDDSGKTWEETNAGLESNLFPRCLTSRSGNVFVGTNQGVYVTGNGEIAWSKKGTYSLESLAANSTTIFAGRTLGGILLSRDDGETWTVADSSILKKSVWSIIVHGDTILAATGDSGVVRSCDNGITWTNESPELRGVYELTEADGLVYAGISSGTSCKIVRSSDYGAGWNDGKWFYNRLINALAVHDGGVFAATTVGILRSTDDGETWEACTSGLETKDVETITGIGETILAGTDGGIFVSTDNGDHWTASNTGLGTTHTDALLSKGDTLFAGTTESGVFFTVDNGDTWNPINAGLTDFTVTAVWSRENTLYAGTTAGLFVSTDNGKEWIASEGALSDKPIRTLAQYRDDIYAGSMYGLYRSTDGGTSWTSTGILADVKGIAVRDSTIFAGTSKGVYRSIDNGDTWVKTNEGLENENVRCITAAQNTVLAGTQSGVYYSRDDGDSWAVVPSGCTNQDMVGFVTVDEVILAASSGGIHYSGDNGINWISVSEGLPQQCSPFSLEVHQGNVFTGIQGRGVWRRPYAEIEEYAKTPSSHVPLAPHEPEYCEYRCSGASLSVTVHLSQPQTVAVAVYDLSGKCVQSFAGITQSKGTHQYCYRVNTAAVNCLVCRVSTRARTFTKVISLVR